jgi:chemotaxis protein histidine kinase CheA
MDILNDPSMKEIVDDFCKESTDLFDQLEEKLEELEDDVQNSNLMEDFGNIIDRVMGAAKSLGAEEIANFCELGKLIGYKSSQSQDKVLLEVSIAILFDAVDLLKKMIDQILTGASKSLENLSTQAFCTRLRWLSEKFKHIERASLQTDGTEGEVDLSQASIDDLMASLGL